MASSYPVRNKDVIYVSTAPISDLLKFVNVVSSMTFSVLNLSTIAQ